MSHYIDLDIYVLSYSFGGDPDDPTSGDSFLFDEPSVVEVELLVPAVSDADVQPLEPADDTRDTDSVHPICYGVSVLAYAEVRDEDLL